MNNKDFIGIIAYPITPFDTEDRIDIPLFRILTERLVEAKVHGIAALGSTGVLPYLSDAEKEAVTEATIQQVNFRLPVMVGVSNLTTDRTIHHAKFAEKAGADAVMILPMSYWKLTDEEIFNHYSAVADKIGIQIMAYNNPATGGVDMSPTLLKKLLEIPNVTMIKESSGDIQRMHYLRTHLGDDVAFYNGSNPLALSAFAAGARGWCTAAPNLIPELNLSLYDATVAGDYDTARTAFYKQLEVLKFITEKGLPRTIKKGLKLMGIDAGNLRRPLAPLSEADSARLMEILNSINN